LSSWAIIWEKNITLLPQRELNRVWKKYDIF
jgi:hypothetical protein